jgi:hypothetical protein
MVGKPPDHSDPPSIAASLAKYTSAANFAIVVKFLYHRDARRFLHAKRAVV